jgi:hypothetical protein
MPRPLIFVLIVALCGALDIGLHMAGSDLMPMPSEFSALAYRIGFGAVAAIWIALAFPRISLRLVRCGPEGTDTTPT